MSDYRTEQTHDQLRIFEGDALVGAYRFLGARRPYFWPLNVAEGSVARGSGTGDHPHQTGFYLAYGLHGHNGASNIWSDWDEPPYGPCGAMHHVEFTDIRGDGFTERLVYTNGDGEAIGEETRDIRYSRVSDSSWRIGWHSHVLSLEEQVKAPFHFSARAATSILESGTVASSARDGSVAREAHPAEWMSAAGALGDGKAGMVLVDHADNPDELGEFWFPSIIMLTHEAPLPFPAGGLHLRCHLILHSDDTPSI
jgi:hypothetical protein